MARGDAIRFWLPVMLTSAWMNALETALEALQRFCISEFRHEYKMAHGAGSWVDADSIKITGHFERSRHEQAQRWLKKRDILARAVEQIKAVDNG